MPTRLHALIPDIQPTPLAAHTGAPIKQCIRGHKGCFRQEHGKLYRKLTKLSSSPCIPRGTYPRHPIWHADTCTCDAKVLLPVAGRKQLRLNKAVALLAKLAHCRKCHCHRPFTSCQQLERLKALSCNELQLEPQLPAGALPNLFMSSRCDLTHSTNNRSNRNT